MDNEKKYYTLLKEASNLLRKNKLDKGYAVTKQALLLFPDKYEAFRLLGDYYGLKGDISLALQNYERAIEINHTSGAAYFNKGQCLLHMGRKNDAVNNLKIAINLDPGIKEVYYLLIPELIMNNQLVESYEYLKDGISQHPDDGVMNFLMANILITYHEELGVKPTGVVLRYLDKAENKGIDPLGINAVRGDYYFEMKEWKKAEKYFSRYLRREYNEDIALKYAATLHELQRHDDLCEVIYAMSENGSAYAKQLMNEYPSCFIEA